MRLKFIDIMMIIVLAATIGLGIWLLIGSPTEMQAIVSLAMFFGASGLFILKKIFSMENNSDSKLLKLDKKASVGFIKVKHDIEKFRIEVNNRFNNIENKLDKIDKKL